MSRLQPIHHSRLSRLPRHTPNNMHRLAMPDGTREALTSVAIDIFTDATNAGLPLQDALLSIYLSGLQHAVECKKEKSA